MSIRWPSEVRLVVFAASFVALSWVVVWRLGQLQIERHEYYAARAQSQHYKKIVIQPERGEILDRSGRCLATSLARMSVYVDPRRLPGDPQSWAGLFSETFGIRYGEALELLKNERPAPLARRLPAERVLQAAAISEQYNLGEDALWFHRETQRSYPRAVASHILGYCSTDGDGDNVGISGVELGSNAQLKGQRVVSRIQRSAIKTVLGPVDDGVFLQSKGETIVLTVDAALQEAAEQALERTAQKYKADAGVVIVMETKTGAIRAMCSYPNFDNNRFASFSASERRNRCLTDPIEPGSVAKIFTISILFDLNRMGPDDLIDCEGGAMYIHGRRVSDTPDHTLHVVPLREVFQFSSNVGTVKAAQFVKPAEYHDMLRRFGFGQKTGIDLPGEGEGLLYPLNRWTSMSMSSLPMGYEMGDTPIQLITAASGIINEGQMMRPYVIAERRDSRGRVVWRAHPTAIREVVRPSTSALVRELMEVVVTSGTGKRAQVANYRTGGKTGTTRKSNHFDQREYIASFMGAVPMDDPQLTVFCSIDNPKGAYYAAEVSAPLFAEVSTAALAQLAIPSTGAPLIAAPGAHASTSSSSDNDIARQTQAILDSLAQERMETAPGEMPDLTGLTMTEARRALQGMNLQVRFLGHGRVVDQSPLAGTAMESVSEAIVVFESPRSESLPELPEEESKEAPKEKARSSMTPLTVAGPANTDR